MLSIAAAHAAQCFLQKKTKLRTNNGRAYYRSTIKMHENSPVAAALFLFHISGLSRRILLRLAT